MLVYLLQKLSVSINKFPQLVSLVATLVATVEFEPTPPKGHCLVHCITLAVLLLRSVLAQEPHTNAPDIQGWWKVRKSPRNFSTSPDTGCWCWNRDQLLTKEGKILINFLWWLHSFSIMYHPDTEPEFLLWPYDLQAVHSLAPVALQARFTGKLHPHALVSLVKFSMFCWRQAESRILPPGVLYKVSKKQRWK